MKVSKKILAAPGGIIACVLIVTTILLLRTPIVVQNDWNGAHPIDTTTPTLTLFPDQGWWTAMPTAPGLGEHPDSHFHKYTVPEGDTNYPSMRFIPCLLPRHPHPHFPLSSSIPTATELRKLYPRLYKPCREDRSSSG